jgi:predicted enzyme related to lactoylglutathione lyase
MSYESRTGAVLFADDVARVASFYSFALGLAEANRDADHILLESPGFQLVVHRIPGTSAPKGDVTAATSRRAAAAFKPVFFVPDIARLRVAVQKHGGVMEPPDKEWFFDGATVCDALDPEGNVIQFRAVAGDSSAADRSSL